jgi:CrcB protein
MIFAIALGSAVGGVSRYLLGLLIQRWAGGAFPLGTLVINISGSFLLGFLLRYAMFSTEISPVTRAMLTTGFCGGYTTFSTYSYETASLIEEGLYARAGVYVGLSVGLALLGTFLGFQAARSLIAWREHGIP